MSINNDEPFEVIDFSTNSPHITNQNNEKILFPFGPPIFQTWMSPSFCNLLIEEGRKLTIEEDDHNFSLAGNLKNGRSFLYKKEFRELVEPKIKEKVEIFIEGLESLYNNEKPRINKERLSLESLWINFQQKHDFNPSHDHSGEFSFIIYCQVPEKIFSIQADSNSQNAGSIIFEYGENMFPYSRNGFVVRPSNNLMFIFPAKLRHYVPPYWIDEERIGVSGNFVLT